MSNLCIPLRILAFPSWYVIHTHALQETRAEDNLKMWGVETFHPKMRGRRLSAAQASRIVIKSLFPCYLFARFDAGAMLHKIRFTRGVRGVVQTNGVPTPVPDEVIDLIRQRAGAGGLVRVGDTLRSGDRVVVKNGPLSDLEGILDKDVNDEDRVLVLLTTVNYQSRVLIDKEMLRKVS